MKFLSKKWTRNYKEVCSKKDEEDTPRTWSMWRWRCVFRSEPLETLKMNFTRCLLIGGNLGEFTIDPPASLTSHSISEGFIQLGPKLLSSMRKQCLTVVSFTVPSVSMFYRLVSPHCVLLFTTAQCFTNSDITYKHVRRNVTENTAVYNTYTFQVFSIEAFINEIVQLLHQQEASKLIYILFRPIYSLFFYFLQISANKSLLFCNRLYLSL